MTSGDRWLRVGLLGLGAGGLAYLLLRYGGRLGTASSPVVVYADTGEGAGYFRELGQRIAQLYNTRAFPYLRFSDLENILAGMTEPVGPLVLLGHGTTSAFYSNLDRPSAVDVARVIAPRLAAGGVVGLAGCRAGANPGEPDWAPESYGPGGAQGYAGQLRDALVREGARGAFQVRAHSTTGDATANPAVRVFSSAPGTRGESAIDLLWGDGAWALPANRSAWTTAFRGLLAEAYISGRPLSPIQRPA
jgi:hypothetical protein